MSSRWYAIYTRSRWEKKVDRLLQEAGIECYCPLNKVHRKWSDRIKVVEEPLFKSYVFVRISELQKTEVRMITGVINFLYWQGKPALIKDREIEAIRRFMNEYEDVEVYNMDLHPEQRVIITGGPFMSQYGKIVSVTKKIAKVAIDSLGCVLVAKIDRKNVDWVRNQH